MRDIDRRTYELVASTRRFAELVERSREELRKAHALGRLVVSTSWGKDSCALAHLALETLGPVPLVHLQSGYELPGGDAVVEYFKARTAVHEVPAKMALDELIAWLQEHGLGYERTELHGAGKKRKADRGIEWAKANGFDVQVLGMRAEEAKGRRMCFRVRGLTYRAHGLIVSNPIGWWRTSDVWAYLVSRGVPWHPLYDCETHGLTREQIRNSGWLTVSPADDARVAWLKQHYPAQYRALAEHFPQVRRLA